MEFHGEPCKETLRGFLISYKGEPYCITGVKHRPTMYEWFSDTKDLSKVPKKTIWRAAKEAYTKIYSMGYPLLYAISDPELPGAGEFLKRLGFVYFGNDGQSESYIVTPKGRILHDRRGDSITDRGDSN